LSGAAPRLRPVDRVAASAWERFASGESIVGGVRAEILASWARSRDTYAIDPGRNAAVVGERDPALAPKESIVAAELGAAATAIAPDAAAISAIVVVADGRGRVLLIRGDERTLKRGREQNLQPLHSWSEHSVGTTGIGTALVQDGVSTVNRFEHWCGAFHDWSCAAVAVRDGTRQPAGVIALSVWRRVLPGRAARWLATAAGDVERHLKHHELKTRVHSAGDAQLTPPAPLRRVVGVRAGRNVILPVDSLSAVTVEDGLIWLHTSEGRVRAAARRLEDLEARLVDEGFLRVSRTTLVNLHSVREIAPAFRGGVWIVVADVDQPVPVSRRRVQALRAAFGV
jgi:hypothetical protein